MKRKIILEEENGTVYDKDNNYLCNISDGQLIFLDEPVKLPVDALVTLREGGYTTEEIIEMHKKGIL